MTNNLVKEKALKILIQNKLYSLVNYNDLQRIIESNQFTIIEYKKYNNSVYVDELIKRLNIENEIEHNNCFLYIKNNFKFLFINDDIPEEDKCSILRHELGHICDPDLKNNNAHYSQIKKEEFANEFSCYIKNPGIIFKFYLLIIKKWKLLVGIMALISCVLGGYFIVKSLMIQPTKPVSNYALSDSTYFVTSAGKKYHRKRCITIKYKNNLTEIKLDDAINKGYKPCMICNPEE